MSLITLTDAKAVESQYRSSPIGAAFAQIEEYGELIVDPLGFYWGFSAAQMIFQHNENWEQWPEFPEYKEPYGVCDNAQQILAKYPELEADGRAFIVTMDPQTKANQSADGGWRWHKWGDYIGDQEPTMEYLYDEPDIDSIICFHIYERLGS